MHTAAQYRMYTLAWDDAREDGDLLRGITRKVFAVTMVLAILMSILPIPESGQSDQDKVPPRFAKLILEKPAPPPPPPVLPKPEEPKLAQEPKPTPAVEKKVEVVEQPKPLPKPIDKTREARKKASVAGLLPFVDDLADLRDNKAVASVRSDRQLAGAAGEAMRAERSMITSRAGSSSGGITTAVSSTVAGLASAPLLDRPDALEAPARSREEIEMVFDQNKGAIYALYNRALRRDPTLQGKMVLQLTIEPSGVVSMCEVLSTDIEDEELQRKLVKRIRLFRFETKDVATITTTKPIDFFPA